MLSYHTNGDEVNLKKAAIILNSSEKSSVNCIHFRKSKAEGRRLGMELRLNLPSFSQLVT